MALRRWRKRLVWSLLVLVAVPFIAAGSGVIWWRQSLPVLDGEVRLPGLSGETRVVRDKHGVPHIFAADLADAARTIGYLHAQDRFFQMDISRRVLEGRLAEIIGEPGLRYDRLFRTLDLAGRGRDSYRALSLEAQKHLQAYAEGVNSWLETSGQALPLEYSLLDFEPEPWQPEDAIIWGKGMAWKLSANWRHDATRAILAAQYGTETAERLFPAPLPDWPVTLDPQFNAQQSRHWPAGSRLPLQLVRFARNQDVFSALATLPSIGAGASNEWVVAGSRSETGMPLLANDPHLELDIPILWYLVRITTPDITLTGASVPGAPNVLVGQNGHIAWGITTTDSDVQDLFIETLAPGQPGYYLTPDGPKPLISETVTIKVRDSEPVELVRRETRHGPVLSGAVEEADLLAKSGQIVSLAWTGLSRRDTTGEAMYLLNLARNQDDFLNAMRKFYAPTQNIVYADRSGSIGFINAGGVPIRKSGDGRYPSNGMSGAQDWTGEVPFSGWPKLFNPPAGAIVNANNADTRNDTGFWFGRDQTPPYRAERILELLAARPMHDLDSLAAIQSDIAAAHARHLLPFLLKIEPDNATERQALDLLASWDYRADKDRPEALVFDWWVLRMNAQLLSSGLDPVAPASGILNASVITDILRTPRGFCDSETMGADCMKSVKSAFSKTIRDLSKRYGANVAAWRWGDEHFAVMDNRVLDNLPGFRALFDISFPSDGGFYSINRGGSLGAGTPEHPLVRKSGAGFRAVYDLADPSRSRFIIATGQSEHPLSPFYADQLELYKRGGYIRLQRSEEELKAESTGTLILRP